MCKHHHTSLCRHHGLFCFSDNDVEFVFWRVRTYTHRFAKQYLPKVCETGAQQCSSGGRGRHYAQTWPATIPGDRRRAEEHLPPPRHARASTAIRAGGPLATTSTSCMPTTKSRFLRFFFVFFLHTGRLASPGRRQAAHDGGGQRGRVRELQGRSRGQALRQEGRQHAHRPPSHFGDDAKGAQGFRKEAFSVHSYSSTYPVSTILCFENDRPVKKRVDVFGAPRTVTDDHV